MSERKRDLSVEIGGMWHIKDEKLYVVDFKLYFGEREPLEVNVAIDDEGQSSETVYRQAREVLAGELVTMRGILLQT